jgi:predicted RND superfamily exporter protein
MDPSFFAPFTDAARRFGDRESVRIRPEPGRFGPSGMPRTRIFFADPSDAPRVAAAVEEALGNPDARIASVALLSEDLGRIIAADFRRAALLVAVAVALLSLAAFRAIGVLVVTLTPVAVGMIWLLGTARLAGVELDLMFLMGLPVVFGLGIDYGVYVVDRWSREGRDPRAALAAAGPAVLVTGLTTLAGFAALLGAGLAGLRSLGFAVVVGAGYTLAAALILLPLLLPIGARSGGRRLHEAAIERGTAAGVTPAGATRDGLPTG